jgi:hypothetical protein
MTSPYLCISIDEMLRLGLDKLLSANIKVKDIARKVSNTPPDQPLFSSRHEFQSLREAVVDFALACEAAELVVTNAALIKLINEVEIAAARDEEFFFVDVRRAEFIDCLNCVCACFETEASLRTMVILPPEKADYLTLGAKKKFGDGVQASFPTIGHEIDSVLRCTAFGISTATVFHLMRILEVGLRAVYQCLRLQVPDGLIDQPWGSILQAIHVEIKRRGKKWPEKMFFQEVYARLDSIKDAWRNPTMHAIGVYTEQEAKELLISTSGLMKKIAQRMDEKGLPFA